MSMPAIVISGKAAAGRLLKLQMKRKVLSLKHELGRYKKTDAFTMRPL